MKSRLGTDNIVYMDEGEINDSFLTPNGSAMATIIAGTPEDGIRLFAEKLGLSDTTRIEGLTDVVFLTNQHLGKFIQAKDCRLPVIKGRNELIEEMAADFIRKAADNDFSISELEKAIESLKLSTGSLKVVL